MIHYVKYIHVYKNCKKKFISLCYSEYKSHDMINLFEFNYSQESKKKLE